MATNTIFINKFDGEFFHDYSSLDEDQLMEVYSRFHWNYYDQPFYYVYSIDYLGRVDRRLPIHSTHLIPFRFKSPGATQAIFTNFYSR